MKTYYEKERFCETTFAKAGTYWHAYTNGRDTSLLFANDEDYTFAMNVIGQAANEYCKTRIIAFAVMSNHFHFILYAPAKEDIHAFFAFIKKRISHSIPAVKPIGLYLKPIENLRSLRNNIVYTNRNGYVANQCYTPFSYPWGTGRYYFNHIPIHDRYTGLYLSRKRTMFRGRAPELPGDWTLIDGYINPSSYCVLEFGMSLFRDAHHYFSMISKSIEAYSDVAVEINDEEYLTDTELYGQLTAILKERYCLSSVRNLSQAQKLDFARILHFDFRSSNGQIRRILGLSQYEVDCLFPFGSKTGTQNSSAR